jgi:hypothetical protein
MQVLIDTLRERENATEDLSDARVELFRQQKMRERDEVQTTFCFFLAQKKKKKRFSVTPQL